MVKANKIVRERTRFRLTDILTTVSQMTTKFAETIRRVTEFFNA